MDEMIYLAMTGAKQTEIAQTINSNNLANVSTTGFKSDLHAFSSVPVDGPGIETRINAVVDSYGTDFGQGPITSTGRHLDVAYKVTVLSPCRHPMAARPIRAEVICAWTLVAC